MYTLALSLFLLHKKKVPRQASNTPLSHLVNYPRAQLTLQITSDIASPVHLCKLTFDATCLEDLQTTQNKAYLYIILDRAIRGIRFPKH